MIGNLQIACNCDKCGSKLVVEFETEFDTEKEFIISRSIVLNELRVWYDWAEIDGEPVCDICKIEEE